MATNCTYRGNREELLIAYLYDAVDPGDRVGFDAHLAACAVCRHELVELRGVRAELAQWAPPEPAAGWTLGQKPVALSNVVWGRFGSGLRQMPAWAQVAAAVLIVGVAAGAANLNVTYNESGLSVRTGWMAPSSSPEPAFRPVAIPVSAPADTAPWRVELAALAQQLRNDLKPVVAQPTTERDQATEQALMRRVRALIDDSEKKQQRELALRIAENASVRVAEMRNIDRNFNAIQTRTGADMTRLYLQQQELAKRVALVR